MKQDFVGKVIEFNAVAGTPGDEFSPRKTALYIGLVLEEVREQIEAIKTPELASGRVLASFAETLEAYGMAFKEGRFDADIEQYLDRTESLDSFVDIAVVALGGGIAVGADVDGATHAVADNNLSKFPLVDGVRTVLKDENGKVKKPEGYKSVDLTKFLK